MDRNHPVAVMVMDADAAVRETVRLLLKHKGYVVKDFPDCAHAIHELEERRFDVLLCFSPGGSFNMACADLATIAKAMQPEIKVVVAASPYDHPDLEKYLAIDAVLGKPFLIKNLTAIIDSLMHPYSDETD